MACTIVRISDARVASQRAQGMRAAGSGARAPIMPVSFAVRCRKCPPAQRVGVIAYAKPQEQEQQKQQQQAASQPGWLQKIAGATALLSLLPASVAQAAESFDPFSAAEPLLEPSEASPGVLGAVLFSVGMYSIVILMWLWISRYSDYSDLQGGGSNSNSSAGQDLDDDALPSGFRQHLGANIRSYRDPKEDAARLAAQLVAAHDMTELKAAVAAQASEHLVTQLKTKYSLVSCKVAEVYPLSRPARQQRWEEAQRRADSGVDAMIDKAVAELAVDGVERYSEAALVRHVMLQVAVRLAREEVAACLGALGDPALQKRFNEHSFDFHL